MSADKHRGKGLEIDASYLALASREWGLSVNRSHAFVLTDRLQALAKAGLVRMRRVGTARSRTTTFHITEAGAAHLAGLRRRFGDDFGRPELVRETEHRRHDQTQRRADAWDRRTMHARHRRSVAARLAARAASALGI